MNITAKIIEDSVSEHGIRLTTVHARYPRFIHAELMTHRVFSRNARSSRAVPVKTMLEEIRTSPVMPAYWGKNQSGMQAREELSGAELEEAKTLWLAAGKAALHYAEQMASIGLHKQIANRVLEPFMYIDTLITATDWNNFFSLRRHPDAQPEMQELANAIYNARWYNKPTLLKPGQWHLPYVLNSERNDYTLETCQRLSMARAARISYKPFDGDASVEAELARAEKLVGAAPIHASPAEHQATPDVQMTDGIVGDGKWWLRKELHGNFRGWIQYRKTLPNENITEYVG